MSSIEDEREKAGAKKAPWKPQAVSKAETLAAKSAGKYAFYEKRPDKNVGAGALPAEVFKKKTLEPVFSKREEKLDRPVSKQPVAHELAHVVQQGKIMPDAKLEYLKYPAAKQEKDAKAKSDRAAKKVIVADRRKSLMAPADSDTLAAIAEKMFEKFSAESELERDITGAD